MEYADVSRTCSTRCLCVNRKLKKSKAWNLIFYQRTFQTVTVWNVWKVIIVTIWQKIYLLFNQAVFTNRRSNTSYVKWLHVLLKSAYQVNRRKKVNRFLSQFFRLTIKKMTSILGWDNALNSEAVARRSEVFCKKGILRNFAKHTGKHLFQRLFLHMHFPVSYIKFMNKIKLVESH